MSLKQRSRKKCAIARNVKCAALFHPVYSAARKKKRGGQRNKEEPRGEKKKCPYNLLLRYVPAHTQEAVADDDSPRKENKMSRDKRVEEERERTDE